MHLEAKMSKAKPKFALITSMAIFATIGIFRKHIPLPSSTVAMARAVIGTLFLVAVILLRGKKISFESIKKNALPLCFSGVFLGFNWILLFEAYNHTTVATATLCYYMAPVILILISPIVFKERLTLPKLLCAVVAVGGMTLVSGIFTSGDKGNDNIKGVLLGLCAALLYAAVVTCNKKLKGIEAFDRTTVQLGISAIVLTPYTLLVEDFSQVALNGFTVIMLVTVGVVHTGIAYALYFGCIDKLKTQTVAIYSYIDPVGAVLLSALFLKEPMGVPEIIGAVLVLGATLASEFVDRKKQTA